MDTVKRYYRDEAQATIKSYDLQMNKLVAKLRDKTRSLELAEKNLEKLNNKLNPLKETNLKLRHSIKALMLPHLKDV